jgi:hypothetical protein
LWRRKAAATAGKWGALHTELVRYDEKGREFRSAIGGHPGL